MIRIMFMFLLLCLAGYTGAQEVKIEKSGEVVMLKGKSFYLHTVRPGQTLFSICKAYGVEVDEVKALNDKKENVLSVGEVLRIPYVEPFKRLDNDFYYHRMRPKETLFSLSQKFGIKMKRVLKDNPGYDVSRPISEGAVVRLALKQIDRKVLEAELRWEDHQSQETIKAKEERQQTVGSRPVQDTEKKSEGYVVRDTVPVVYDYPPVAGHLKIALLLPFCLKENRLPLSSSEVLVDSLGVPIRNERDRLSSRSEPFLQFYQGVLMAVDSLKNMGYTIDLYVFDTEKSVNVVQRIVEELNQLSPDLIIGPVYANTYKVVAEQLVNKSIPMIYPLSARSEDLGRFSNFVQTNISTHSLVEEMAKWVATHCGRAHIVNIIPDGAARGGEAGRLSSLVRTYLHGTGVNGISDYRMHTKVVLDSLRRALRPGMENIVLFPSVDEAAASRLLPVLSALADHYQITVIGFPEWLKFTSIDDEVFFKLNMKVFTNSYVDYQGDRAKAFSAKHRDYFFAEPNNITNRAYDITMCFVPLVDSQRRNTLNVLMGRSMNGSFTRFRFGPMNGGGLENRGLYLINYNSGYNIIVTPLE